jgi:long-chain fatty acid transport protein
VLVAVAAAAAAAVAPTRAAGSPLDLFGFGGRSPALAGTGVATATDYDAVYLNPAGLADARKRLTAGGLYGDFALELDGASTGTEQALGTLFGGALPIPFGGALADRVGLGLGFYVPTVAINRARHPLPGVPTYVLLESRSHVIAIQIAAGVRLGGRERGLRLGVGVIALAALTGNIDVASDAADHVSSASEQQLVTQLAPVIGARWVGAARGLDLGLTFRAPSRSDYDITVSTERLRLPITLPEIRIAGTAQYDPLTVAAEAAWRPAALRSLELRGQLAYQRWSAFPPPTLDPIASQPTASPGFHDILVPRLAAEWLRGAGATQVALRGGYAYVASPAPEATSGQALLDSDRHLLAAGLGLSWPGTALPLHVDLWAQAHLLAGRDSAIAVPEGDGSLRAGGHILVGGATIGVDL